LVIDEAFSDVVVAVYEISFYLSGVEVTEAIAEQRIVHVGVVVDNVIDVAANFVVIDRRAVLYARYIRDEQATHVVVDLVIVDISIDTRFNGEFVIVEFVVQDFTVIGLLNGGDVVRKNAILNSSVVRVIDGQTVVEKFAIRNNDRIYCIRQKGSPNLVVDETTIAHGKSTGVNIECGGVVFEKAIVHIEIGPAINPDFIIDEITAR
jgi:hypothetical protein